MLIFVLCQNRNTSDGRLVWSLESSSVLKVEFDDNIHQRMRLVYETAGTTSNFALLVTRLALLEELGHLLNPS